MPKLEKPGRNFEDDSEVFGHGSLRPNHAMNQRRNRFRFFRFDLVGRFDEAARFSSRASAL